MNQLPRWILCAALCCAASSCDSQPDPGQTAGGPKGVVVSMNTPSDVAAAPSDARKTSSGIAYRVLRKGKAGGKTPKASSTVKTHYSGWTTDGKLFDSSMRGGQPLEFPLGAVIPGWTEGLQLMREGEITRFWIPGSLAYDGMPGKPQGTLVFDIELIEVK